MSCTPRRSCQQAAKLSEIQAAQELHNAPVQELHNAPPTPGLSVFGAFAGEGETPPSPQDEPRQEVTEDHGEPDSELTHQAEQSAGAQADSAQEKEKRQGLSEKEKECVALLLSVGYSLRQAAARIERAHTTISRQMKRDPEFAAQVERFRSYAESDALTEVVKASRKSWRAAAWLLTYLERRDQKESAEIAG